MSKKATAKPKRTLEARIAYHQKALQDIETRKKIAELRKTLKK